MKRLANQIAETMTVFLLPRPAGYRIQIIFLLFIPFTFLCGCSATRYADGNITNYLYEPIPDIDEPIAATFNLEVIEYMTAANMYGTLVSDHTNREMFLVPKEVGRKVENLLELDNKFSGEATIKALNKIAEARAEARNSNGNTVAISSDAEGTYDESYVQYHEQLASEAYNQGDYLLANIHTSAAANHIAINSSFSQAQSSLNMTFAVFGALAAVGEAMAEGEFLRLRNWIEHESGIISKDASKKRNLNVFFFQFFDAEKFKWDSRMRVAVLLVLVDEDGIVDMVLEGSDLLTCNKDCDLFPLKNESKLLEPEKFDPEVKKRTWSKEARKELKKNGFDNLLGGPYHYVLFHHGIKKLQASLMAKEKTSK